MTEEKVNIRVSLESRKELKEKGTAGDTLDDVVQKLIDKSEILDQIIDLSEEAGEIEV